MSDFAGSKRPASTPFASPSKVASKRSRTKYDYGDEDDLYSSAEDQWSAGDADSLSWDSEGDDLDVGNFMPSPSADLMSISSEGGEGREYSDCPREKFIISEVSQPTISIKYNIHILKLARSPLTLLMRRQQKAQDVNATTPMLLNRHVSNVFVQHWAIVVKPRLAAVTKMQPVRIHSTRLMYHQYLAQNRSPSMNAS